MIKTLLRKLRSESGIDSALLVLSVTLGIVFHLGHASGLNKMNQIPMEGSSASTATIPIHFDASTLEDENWSTIIRNERGYLGSLNALTVRRCYQAVSLASGLIGSLILLLLLSYLERRRVVQSLRFPRTVVYVFASLFAAIHYMMLITNRSKMLTKELMMMTTVSALTVVMYVILGLFFIRPLGATVLKNVIRSLPKLKYYLLALGVFVFLALTTMAVSPVINDEDVTTKDSWFLSSQFFSTATGDTIDICQSHNLGVFTSSIRYGIMWPQFLPRRLLNFFTGTEECGDALEAQYVEKNLRYTLRKSSPAEFRNLLDFSQVEIGGQTEDDPIADNHSEVKVHRRLLHPMPGRHFSQYDRSTQEILVPTKCPTSSQPPVVVLDDFRRNQMGHNFEDIFPTTLKREFKLFNKNWPMKVILKYGPLCNNITWKLKAKPTVMGDPNAPCTIHLLDDNHIVTIERVCMNILDSSIRIAPNHAPSRAFSSNTIRINGNIKYLPVPTLPVEHLRLPLISEATSIFCGEIEEYHVHPLFDAVAAGGVVQSEIDRKPDEPRNLIMLVLDAVSRQEFLRSLPLTSSFLRMNTFRFRSKTKFVVQEWKGHTTIGHSTWMNLAPTVGGSILNHNRSEAELLSKSNIWNLAKARYGNRMYTSIISGTCSHTTDMLADSTLLDVENKYSARSKSKLMGGAGGPLAFMDKDQFASMCHVDFGGLEGNFQGPNSITRRCIARRHVHDHVLEYTEDLIFHTLVSAKGGNLSKHFLHMSYFMEGHEGTHSVLAGMDLSLYRFLRRLEVVYEFFSNPKNLLLLMSDHGNHMGPYYEWSSLGKAERRNPLLVFIGSPIAENELQHQAAKVSSESATNAYDLYATLCDILRVHRPLEVLQKPLSFISEPWADMNHENNPRKVRNSCASMNSQDDCILGLCEKGFGGTVT